MPIWSERDFFGQAKFIVLSVRTSIGQCQFIVQSDNNLGGQATRVD